jgi:hypothetical protein
MQRLPGNLEGQFVFLEPVGTLEPYQVARVLIRIMSAGAMVGRPVEDLIGGLNAQGTCGTPDGDRT